MYIRIFKDKQDVASGFSDFLVNEIIGEESVHIALSGGSTPKLVFDVIADKYGDQVDWSKVHFYWGDERCVAPTDDQSNFKMTQEHLLSKIDIPTENIHRIFGENNAEIEAKRYGDLLDERLRSKHGIPQFDLVILGMGDDGHTASIFPHQIELWDAPTNCVIAQHPESGQQRVSLTGKIINNAASVVFLVTGDNKKYKVDEILNKNTGSKLYPASLVSPVEGDLFWYMDEDAASRLID